MAKDGWKQLFLPENKKMRSNILLAFLMGILLLLMGKGFSFSGQKAESIPQDRVEASASGAEMERRMAEILSEIEGAGQVDVMLTYCRREEKSVAREESKEENGEKLRTEEKVILLEDGDGATMPLVLTEYAPVVEGVLITAQGANDPAVVAALNQAAQALLDVPAHKVAVLKMK